jgi:hypothetical protein
MHLATTKCCFSGPTSTVDGPRAQLLRWRTALHDITCSGRWSHTGLVAESTIVKKSKWLLVNVPGYKSAFSTATEFLNSYRDGTSASVFWGIMLDGSYGLRVTTHSVHDRCNSACTKHYLMPAVHFINILCTSTYCGTSSTYRAHQHTVHFINILRTSTPF